MIHGDSVYDIIDKQDHASIQTELMRGLQLTSSQSQSGSSATTNGNDTLSSSTDPSEKRIFLCRMNVSRNARRQMRFGDQKVGVLQGYGYNFDWRGGGTSEYCFSPNRPFH